MGNTTFFKRADEDANQIKWKDLFSESLKHHTKEDLEYALLAGTSMDKTTEQNMLQKWRKPWLYLRFLGIGAVVVLLMLVLEYLDNEVLFIRVVSADHVMAVLISLFVPVGLMIFFWEINIPRNITWYQLALYFVLGAILSFFVTGIFFIGIPGSVTYKGIEYSLASLAAFREEPAKLAAAVIILFLFFRNKRMYGLTGLVIGAAVGAGFGGFESITYGLEYGTETELLRAFLAVGGHALFCAPYAAAVALNSPCGRFTKDSIFNKDFAVTFLASVAGHFVWNSGVSEYLFVLAHMNERKFNAVIQSEQMINKVSLTASRIGLIKEIFVMVFLWTSCIYILRKCLKQAVMVGRSQAWKASLQLQFVSGPLGGKVFECGGASSTSIGRNRDCDLVIPEAGGVSRRHCRIQYENGKWILQDLNSSYGTMVNGTRINAMAMYSLNTGDRVSLGSDKVSFIIK
ncbi:MAG: FHA domain-containing protein [Eubacteriales bacterium]|nr:FHA domain-containing protein [Eubacteriales bacterium]